MGVQTDNAIGVNREANRAKIIALLSIELSRTVFRHVFTSLLEPSAELRS
jgi:hypothetical protein